MVPCFKKRDGPAGGKRTVGNLEGVAFGNTEPTGAALLQRGAWGGKVWMAITVVIYEKPAAKRIEKGAAIRQIKRKIKIKIASSLVAGRTGFQTNQ